MPYLECIWKEVNRYFGPGILVFFREAMKDTKIQEIEVKKGTLVTCGFLQNFYNPAYFKEPFEFNPDRWLGEEANNVLE